MKTTLSAKLHAATWIVAGILALVPIFSHGPIEQIVGTVVATLFWMAVYYLFYSFIAPNFLLSKKLLSFFSISIVLLLALPFVGYTLLLLTRGIFHGTFVGLFDQYSLHMHLSGFKAMLLAGLFGSFFRLTVEFFGE